jgi:hypothetical protein
MIKKRRTKIINLLTKIVLVLLFIFILYKQVFDKDNLDELLGELLESIGENPFLPVFVFVLMIANWSLESLKWQSLVSKYEPSSFSKSFKTILISVATGIVTPAKLGEYFGRVLLIESKNNWKAVWSTLISSIAQNVVTIFFGIFGLTYLLKEYYNIENFMLNSTFYIGLIGVVVLLFLYYNIDLGLKILRRIGLKKYADKILSKEENINDFTSSIILNKVLVFSVLRYIVFAMQYYLLLTFFGVEGDLIAIFSAITAIFLIQTSIPLPPITNIFARGEIAILVFGHFTNNEILILSSTFGLWLINLVFPALVGVILIFKIDVAKSLGLD